MESLSASERRERLKGLFERSRGCTRCALHQKRTQVVFGAGNADAELMFVGEAPGFNEDRQGLPFVGQAGRLLEKLLGEIGMARGEVFIANVLMCRPPDNRDPHPHEVEACEGYLWEKIALIEPTVICTLGNFATKLLRGEPTGISRLHGREEVRVIGCRAVRLYPLYHPAAALYHPATLERLREDFHRIPELLALGAPAQPVEFTGAAPEQTGQGAAVAGQSPARAGEHADVAGQSPARAGEQAVVAGQSPAAGGHTPERRRAAVQLGLF